MSDIERAPCPTCGEPTALAGRICPFCRASLLVDLTVEPRPDARTVYHLARGLASHGAPFPPFPELQKRLLAGAPLVGGLTREEARAAAAAIEGAGAIVVAAPARTPEEPEPRRRSALAPLIGAAAVGAVLLFVFVRRGPPESGAAPAIAARTVATSAAAGRGAGSAVALSTRELAERHLSSTVVLRCDGSTGSGFFVGPDLVLTNEHVLCGTDEAIEAVFADGTTLPGEPLRSDSWLDLALVRVAGANAAPLALGDATAVAAGDRVVVIGAPRSLDFSIHEGIVSHVERNLLGVAYLQVDASVNPGNSGGPLLDGQGRVIGVVSAKVEAAEGLGLALPINYAYSGDDPFVPAPAAAGSRGKDWTALLQRIAEADRAQARELADSAGQNVVLGLTFAPGHGVVAVIGRRDLVAPGPEPVALVFRRGDEVVCRVESIVEAWRPVDDEGLELSPRHRQWLVRHDLADGLYAGAALLDLDGCEDVRGAELELEQ